MISPPLTPMLSPELAPFDPSSETGELPMLPASSDSVAAEVEQLDHLFKEEDRIQAPGFRWSEQPEVMGTDTLMQMYPPLHADLRSNSTSPPPKRKAEDLKIEVPLIASDSASSTASKKRKTVSFAEQISTLMADIPPSRPIHQLSLESEASLDAFFDEVIEPAALQVEQFAQQEQLQAADAVQRVDVPKMDFALALPPWKKHGQLASGRAKQANLSDDWTDQLKEIQVALKTLTEYGPLTMNAKLERQLQPYPFDASLGIVPPERSIGDSRYIAVIMSDMSLEDVVRSDDLTWKPDGLRIMNRYREDVEDELQPLEHEEAEVDAANFDDLVFQRQQELLRPRPHHPAPVDRSLVVPQRRSSHGKQKGRDTVPIAQKRIGSDFQLREPVAGQIGGGDVPSLFFGGGDNTTNKLHAFMNSKGQDVKKAEALPIEARLMKDVGCEDSPGVGRDSQGVREQLEAAPRNHQESSGREAGRRAAAKRPTDQVSPIDHAGIASVSTHMITPPLAVPELPKHLPNRAVVLSLDMLQAHRPVLRTVFKELYPNADHIERDFTSVKQAAEADILLSPGTGLILTSLQKLKQKSLPGQAVQLNGVRDRINKLAQRYEMLVVLVGNAVQADASDMDQRDCDAMTDFTSFCAQSKAEIVVVYAPNGDQAIATWIASMMLECGDTGQDMALLQEETMVSSLHRQLRGLTDSCAVGATSSTRRHECLCCAEHPRITQRCHVRLELRACYGNSIIWQCWHTSLRTDAS